MTDYAPAVSALLMQAADPATPIEDMAPILLEFDTREACIELAVETAYACTAATDRPYVQTGPIDPAAIQALTCISQARHDDPHLPTDLAELTTSQLSAVTVSLLQVWRRTNADLQTASDHHTGWATDQALEAVLRPSNATKTLGDRSSRQNGSEGRTA